ncbi:MAG: DUF1847 domain-containing protein [Spirochaetales bacterium]|nr:DUF1847 domain-containing protein [Spirochaetales bacterium]
MKSPKPQCARCPYQPADRLCCNPDGKYPDFCPTKNYPDLTEKSRQEYSQSSTLQEFARQATIQEGSGYKRLDEGKTRAVKTRIEEIIEFAHRMNYRKIGLIFCLGLAKEAKVVNQIFSENGLEMVSAVCKVGQTPKKSLGITPEQQINPNCEESLCNPVLQAMILNEEKTDFNVLLGLCVGHDSMAFQYSQAPCTVLAVKDRVLGHNPLAAIYTGDSYYRFLK